MKSSYKSKWCLRHTFEFIMSSSPSSVTQQSASSVSMVVSNMENHHHHMFTSYQDLSGQDTYHKMWQLETKGICIILYVFTLDFASNYYYSQQPQWSEMFPCKVHMIIGQYCLSNNVYQYSLPICILSQYDHFF